MKALMVLLVPAALFAGQARFARLGDSVGKVEAQLQAAEPWIAAERNLPLPESAWLRTGPAARVEIELDEGSALRLGPDSLAEISDYARLSTGQRVTLLSLDRGLAYFTGEPVGKDSLSIAVPGAHLIFTRGARIRIQALESRSDVSIIEGSLRVSSPEWEMEVHEGQTIRIDVANPSRFNVYREVAANELDGWSEDRDKALDSPASRAHVAERYGLADLDRAGEWVQTDAGSVWKPKAPTGWTPFQYGRWRWYDALGYTWVSDDAWGWLPFHYGRWSRNESLGWVWTPSKTGVFKPGDVYWLRGAKLAGWGPLAPGEEWKPSAPPLQFLNVNTTYAAFQQDARTIDPAGFADRPKEPLGVAVFAAALPSPAFIAARLETGRPVLRAGSTRVAPVLPGVTYDAAAPPPDQITDRRPAIVTNPGAPEGSVVITDPPPDAYPPAPAPPVDVIYPVPVYTGIVVVNPPENPDYVRRRRPPVPPAQRPAAPSTSQPATGPTPAPEATGSRPRDITTRDAPPWRRPPTPPENIPAPRTPAPPPTAAPASRSTASGRGAPAGEHRTPPPAAAPAAPAAAPAPRASEPRRPERKPDPDKPAPRAATDKTPTEK